MKLTATILFLLINLAMCQPATSAGRNTQPAPVDYLQASIDLIKAQQQGQSTEAYTKLIEASSLDELVEQLDTDAKRFAFWINVYNGYIQLRLSDHPEYYDDRRSFFKKELIQVAGEQMSFADIEHGIIRRSQFEYFLGYVSNPFAAKFKKKLRPKKRDYRIHFALNCGAKSCPPVRAYTAENLESQMADSAQKFLDKFSEYDATTNTVTTTALFSWFRGDFGGKKGAKKILSQHGIAPSADVNVSYAKYDWTLYLNNYVEGSM